MDNINQILKKLQKQGFVLTRGNGSAGKLYPPDKKLPFYSIHIGNNALHPLRRFAKQHWNLDLTRI